MVRISEEHRGPCLAVLMTALMCPPACGTNDAPPEMAENLSQHNNLTVPGLLAELDQFRVRLEKCAARSAADSRSQFDRLYAQIASMRQGKPTILRTINRYNDFIGAPNLDLTPAQQRRTATFVARWNTTICTSAAANGFGCGDVSKAFKTIAQVLAGLGFAPLA
ncbi:hypothetical protein ACFY36_12795 [Actinoplanes sp. NPDC000266]